MPVDIHDHMHDHIHVNEKTLVKKDDHRQMKQMFAGGFSAALTRTASQPLDVLKVRFQLQVEPLTSKKSTTVSKYSNMRNAVSTIYKDEGILALWKGHNPGQVLSIMFGIAQFWSFEQFTLIAKENKYLKNSPNAANFLGGAISGGLATFCAQPLDVLRTRLIAQDHGVGYRNSMHGMSNIMKTEGITGLYRGINPSLIQIMPLMGTNFMIYKLLKNITAKTLNIEPVQIPSLALMVIGGISGTVSKTIVYPFDLVKKRLQIQGFHKHRKTYGKNVEYKGIVHCLSLTVAQEGFMGLFKGMTPTLLKSGWSQDTNKQLESLSEQLGSIEHFIANYLDGSETRESLLELLEYIDLIEVEYKHVLEMANSVKPSGNSVKDMSDQLQYHMQLLEKNLEVLQLEHNADK